MRQAVLLGNPGTKRTVFMERAAEKTGVRVAFLDWKSWEEQMPDTEVFLKIDPPLWDSSSLEELESLVEEYKEKLTRLSYLEKKRSVVFLNHPSAIEALLDKRGCKDTLRRAGIPVTESLGSAGDMEQLTEIMDVCRLNQVFIKPVNGSGAAGVAAFRRQPKTGKMALYTCAADKDGRLINTRRLRRFSEQREIRYLLEKLLKLDCIVERWYAKETYQNMSYDLRAVMQDGKLDYLLARLSDGPITNLHLNNHPLAPEELKLSVSVREKVKTLCQNAMACYPGLQSAGIDILLEKDSRRPRIIEMNAQGDLIYRDIYNKNIIYCHQTEMMGRWLSEPLMAGRAELEKIEYE